MVAARGVYLEEISPPGERWYKIVHSSGKVGIVHFPEELCDDELINELWQMLDEHDPAPGKRHDLGVIR